MQGNNYSPNRWTSPKYRTCPFTLAEGHLTGGDCRGLNQVTSPGGDSRGFLGLMPTTRMLLMLLLAAYASLTAPQEIDSFLNCSAGECWMSSSINETQTRLLQGIFGRNLGRSSTFGTFLSNYFEQRIFFLDRRNPDLFSSIVEPNDIDSILQKGSDNTTIRRESDREWQIVKRVLQNGDWWTQQIPIVDIHLKDVGKYFQSGFSIIINTAQHRSDSINYVTDTLMRVFGHHINANLYITPPGAQQAFEAHFDWMDAFVLQITGCKKWKLYNPRAVPFPKQNSVFKPTIETLSQYQYQEIDLHAGSLLYIPRGIIHEAATNCSSPNNENIDDDDDDSACCPCT